MPMELRDAAQVLYDFHRLLESRAESFAITRTRSHQYEAVRRLYLDLRKMMRRAGIEVPPTLSQVRDLKDAARKAERSC